MTLADDIGTEKPLLLDLFSGAGGSAWGYFAAGFYPVGVDHKYQRGYPFHFIHDDVFNIDKDWVRENFAAVHASPPCQVFSVASKSANVQLRWDKEGVPPDLIEVTRALLKDIGLPYVIENVPEAPLVNPVLLCGTMFDDVWVIRHRLFESSFYIKQPYHVDKHPRIGWMPDKVRRFPTLTSAEDSPYRSVTGGGNSTVEDARRAMGIKWMTKRELNQAIPPAYTKYIGKQLLDTVRACL